MARDYVARNRRPPPRPAGLPGWVWLVAGLSMGLVVAAVVYIGRPPQPMPMNQTRPSVNASAKPKKVEIPPAEKPRFDFYTMLEREQVVVPAQDQKRDEASRPVMPPPPAPAQQPAPKESATTPPATPATSTPNKPAAAPAPAATPQPKTAASDGGARYLVVAGAFREPGNAEEHKARLAFVGIEAGIERITGQDQQTWHRVRIGPSNLARAEQQLAQLKANGFDGRVVKLP